MIGRLPTTITVNDIEYNIRTDYRDCLVIIQAFNDKELSEIEKARVLLECLYVEYETISEDDIQEAYNKAVDFLNCGIEHNFKSNKVLYDFEQDEQIIFSAVNKVAGKEVRNVDYMHWWTFLGLFNEIGEGSFSTIVSIRNKKQSNKKLDKWEQDFYRENKNIVDIKPKYTAEEEAERDEIRKLLGII